MSFKHQQFIASIWWQNRSLTIAHRIRLSVLQFIMVSLHVGLTVWSYFLLFLP